IVVKEGRAYQVAAVPVLAPEPIAWAIFGYVIDDAMAKDLQALSALDVSFAARSRGGEWSIIASTTSMPLQETLRAALGREPGLKTSHVMPDDDKYETLVLPMPLNGGEPIVAVLQRSLDDSLGSIRRLGAILIALAIGGLAVSVIGSVIIARGGTRPVRALSAMTVRLEEGDYSEPVRITGNDEIGELARRFDLMREGIAQREQDVLRLAYQDSLTGLPNRVLFNDRLNAAIAAAACADLMDPKSGCVAVLLMDIDRFRYINDVLGHQVGDQVVQQVALRLAGLVSNGATTARLGGDEFAVLLPRSDVDDALAMGQTVLCAFEGPLTVGTQSVDVRTSIGV